MIALWSTREWAAKGGFRNRFACRKCPLHLWEVFHAKSGPKSPLLPPCWGTYFTCRSDFFFVCVCAVLGTKIYMCSLAGSFHEFGFSCSSHFIHQQVYCHFGSWSRRCSKQQQQQQQKVDVWKIWLSGWMVWQNGNFPPSFKSRTKVEKPGELGRKSEALDAVVGHFMLESLISDE